MAGSLYLSQVAEGLIYLTGRMQLSTAERPSEKYKTSAMSEILLEMMSLSCELSALLSQSKFL